MVVYHGRNKVSKKSEETQAIWFPHLECTHLNCKNHGSWQTTLSTWDHLCNSDLQLMSRQTKVPFRVLESREGKERSSNNLIYSNGRLTIFNCKKHESESMDINGYADLPAIFSIFAFCLVNLFVDAFLSLRYAPFFFNQGGQDRWIHHFWFPKLPLATWKQAGSQHSQRLQSWWIFQWFQLIRMATGKKRGMNTSYLNWVSQTLAWTLLVSSTFHAPKRFFSRYWSTKKEAGVAPAKKRVCQTTWT